jgi:hypothetical protein
MVTFGEKFMELLLADQTIFLGCLKTSLLAVQFQPQLMKYNGLSTKA